MHNIYFIRQILPVFTLLLAVQMSEVYAYPPEYPPYKFGEKQFKSSNIAPVFDEQHSQYKSNDGQIVISKTTGKTSGSDNFTLQDGKSVLLKIDGGGYPRAVYTVDLDNNGLNDFIVFYNGGASTLIDSVDIFLKKSNSAYEQIHYGEVVEAGIEDFIDLDKDGKYEIIITSLLEANKHSYLYYDIYRINDYKLVNSDLEFKGFPKFIWYTQKTNDQDATHLTIKQKQDAIKDKNESIEYEEIKLLDR